MTTPTPGELSADSRNWALAAHLSAFLGAWLTLAFVGPLVVWLLKRGADPFAERHAREALNFNLTMLVLLWVGFLIVLFTLGLGAFVVVPLCGAVGLVWLVFTIIAAVRASNGEEFSYPLSIRFVR